MIQQLHFCVISKRIESMDSNRYFYTRVHSSIIQNSQKTETIQISIDRWMYKQNVIATQWNVIQPWKRNGVLIHTTYMNLEDISLNEVRQTQNIWFHLHEISKIGKFMKTESIMVAARGLGDGEWKVVFNGYRVWNDGKVLEMADSDGYTKMWIYLMLTNYTLKDD